MSQRIELQPVFFFVFSDSENDLPELRNEENNLRAILRTQNASNQIDCDFLQLAYFETLINQVSAYHQTLSIFHYAGHASPESLQLKNRNFEVKTLCNLLNKCPNLKLVFLNGCYTDGFVEELFKHGVPAVIATKNAVPDKTALAFSKSFYQFLTDGKTVKDAFNLTSDGLTAATTSIQLRSASLGDEEEDEDEEPFIKRWQLLVNENKQAVLDWTISNFDVTIGDRKTAIDIKDTLEEMDKVKKTIQKSLQAIKFLEGSIKDGMGGNVAEDMLSTQKATLKTQAKTLSDLENKLKKLFYSQYKYDIKKALPNINYTNQITTILDNSKNRAFIVKGTEQCGHGIILDRLRRIKKIHQIAEDSKEIRIPFRSNTHRINTVADIWKLINQQLLGKESDDVKTFIKTLNTTTISTKYLFIRFESYFDRDAKLLKAFWTNFHSVVQPQLKVKIDIWLFVMYRSRRDFSFDKVKASNIVELPLIEPLKDKDVTQLIATYSLPEDDIRNAFQQINLEGDRYVLPTLKELCVILNQEEVYDNYFKAHEVNRRR